MQRIRKIPGQGRFLLGSTAQELQMQARDGPIVVVNITDIRSDATIVRPSQMTAIRLPDFTASEARKWINQDFTSFDSIEDYGKKTREYQNFLAWIWSKCVKPVAEDLETNHEVGMQNITRLWWIGVGIASTMPFHAAGDHSKGVGESIFGRAISSYTPTIKALQYARESVSNAMAFRQDNVPYYVVKSRSL